MHQPSHSNSKENSSLLKRLDRIFGELNAFLFAIAIGLAVLDFTCFVTLRASADLSRMAVRTAPAAPSGSFGSLGQSAKPISTGFPGR